MNQKHSLSFFKQAIVGTLAGTLINFWVFNPPPARAGAMLGVIRSNSTSNWSQIEGRLQASQISYTTVDLENLSSIADLAGIQVLFLPNVEVLKTDQVKIIQQWVNQGGKLIASGPVGQKSTPLARQLLRSLLGSYWAFPLSSPARPEGRNNLCREEVCRNLTEWSPQLETENTVNGGVLIPSTLESYTAGTWEGSGGSPSVITTQSSTYLGWRWGANQAADLDTTWLQAAVGRYRGGSIAQTVTNPTPPATAINPSNSNQTAVTTSQPNPPQKPPAEVTTPPPVSSNSRVNNNRVNSRPQRSQPPQPQQNSTTPPPSSPSTETRFSTPTTRNNSATSQTASNRPTQRRLLDIFTDPSEQEAPAGLEVTAGNEPIDEFAAVAMRQELVNLLGRFENALIAGSSGNTPVNLTVASTQLNEAVAQSRNPFISKTALEVIAFVQQTIKDFPELVAQQNWAAARQQWLEARSKLWQNYPTEGERAGAEIRAVWLDRGTIIASQSEAGLAQVFDRLAAAGINTVFFETLNAGYPIYPSRIAPQQNPLSRGWDPLASAVKLAHERDMELHAWIWAFATANQRHNTLIGQPQRYLGPVLTAHPTWANRDNSGNVWNERDGKAYLDPANPEVRSYLLRLVGEIVYNYEVDGIQLDYIRYPFQDANRNFTFGYGQAGREEFKKVAGVDPMSISPKDTSRWQQWTQFRVNQVTSLVAEVSQFLRQQYPNVILSVAVFAHPEQERINIIQQHWETWAQQNYVDLIVPMTYSLDTNRLQRITQPLTDPDRLGATLITPSVKLLNIPDIVAVDQIQALRDLPTGGYSIFAVETIGNNLQTIFSRTQGCANRDCDSSPIPYRQPFVSASARYTALKREWSFLLANNQLWIRDNELQALGTKAEELAQALNQLAEDPSATHLKTAKRLLSDFRQQFTRSMRLQALERAYQVESWDNRLVGVEMLLRYGERVQVYRR